MVCMCGKSSIQELKIPKGNFIFHVSGGATRRRDNSNEEGRSEGSSTGLDIKLLAIFLKIVPLIFFYILCINISYI